MLTLESGATKGADEEPREYEELSGIYPNMAAKLQSGGNLQLQQSPSHLLVIKNNCTKNTMSY